MYKGEDVIVAILSKKGKMDITQLAKETGLNEDSIRRAIESLKSSGYVDIETIELPIILQTEELDGYGKGRFPEISVFYKALEGAKISDLNAAEKSIGLRWAKVKNLVTIEAGAIKPSKSKEDVDSIAKKLHSSYKEIDNLHNLSDPIILEEFMERKLVLRKAVKQTLVRPTGKKYVADIGFDLNVPGANAPMGRTHPITKMTKKMRGIMLELGFTEMEGSIAESSFWNFDALFQPQDHPARELADTFYLHGEVPLPEDEALVSRVKEAHEKGWKYKWNPKEAMRRVLRTHTTALSARYVAGIKDKRPKKYFAIGRVFRNEATDYKHLAEFHQVEGIIAWEGAKFTDLLGILKEFYRKLGFEKIRFRPSFFPYTEPSLEIEVYFEDRKQWMELGGAGIFRPEVSEPLAGIYPVLAWGLSLERPLMLGLKLDDIRTFYKNDVDFLMNPGSDI